MIAKSFSQRNGMSKRRSCFYRASLFSILNIVYACIFGCGSGSSHRDSQFSYVITGGSQSRTVNHANNVEAFPYYSDASVLVINLGDLFGVPADNEMVSIIVPRFVGTFELSSDCYSPRGSVAELQYYVYTAVHYFTTKVNSGCTGSVAGTVTIQSLEGGRCSGVFSGRVGDTDNQNSYYTISNGKFSVNVSDN